MNRFNNTLIGITLICFFYSNNSFSQWSYPKGPGADHINCVSTNGQNIYAGTYRGFYITTDNGLNWICQNPSIFNNTITSFVFDGTDIFVGAMGWGVQLSTDNGLTWMPRNGGGNVLGCRMLIKYEEYLFAAVHEGVCFSTDKGLQWTKTSFPLDVGTLCIDTSGSGSPVLLAGGGGYNFTPGIYCSTDFGNSWTFVYEGEWIFSMTSGGGKIYAGYTGGVLVSNDRGITWTQFSAGSLTAVFSSLAIVDSKLYAGTSSGLFYSDNGQLWINVTNTSSTTSLFRNENYFFYSDYSYGFSISMDLGLTWEKRNAGIISTDISSLCLVDNFLFAGSSDGGLFLSADEAEHWVSANSGLSDDTVLSVVKRGSNYFAGTYNSVFISEDDGITWDSYYPLPSHVPVNCLLSLSSKLFAGTTEGVFLSFENDSNWYSMNNGLVNTEIRTLVYKDTVLIAGTGGGVFTSIDKASTWNMANSGLSNLDIRSVAYEDTNLFAGTAGGVFLSTDFGNHWFEKNNGLPDLNIRCIIVTPRTQIIPTVVVTTFSGEIFVSTDYGTSWTIPQNKIYDYAKYMAMSETKLFVGASKGVYSHLLSRPIWVSVESLLGAMPDDIQLYQNYPNPFNPKTTISFSIPQSEVVELKVFDLLGNEVVTLVNEYKEAGEHTVEFNSTNLTSGIYFYRIRAGKFVQAKKMVLMK